MLTLEQRVKRLERLLKMNESESDTISLFREVNDKEGKRTLIRTFTADNITPQGVVDAIIKDANKANYANIYDYVPSKVFDRFYEHASDDIDERESGIGSYSSILEDNGYNCLLCVGNDVNNNIALFVNATLSVEVSADYDSGDSYEYGGVYGDGWYIDDDETEVNINYDGMADSEDNLVGDGHVVDKIREVVDGIFGL